MPMVSRARDTPGTKTTTPEFGGVSYHKPANRAAASI
jgi:hypothetical protein